MPSIQAGATRSPSEGPKMKLVARMFGTLAVVAALASPLWADDTAKKDDSSSSRSASRVSTPPAGSDSGPTQTTSTTTPRASTAPRANYDDVLFPRVELFLGYSYIRGVPEDASNRIVSLHGGDANVAINFNRHWGLVGDFSGYHASELQFNGPGTSRVVDANGDFFMYMGGPRYSFRHERWTPFLHALFGVANAKIVTVVACTGSPVCTPLPSETVFAMALGGGLDVKVRRHFALRLVQAEYLMTRFRDPSTIAGERSARNNMRLSTGVVFRFGGNPPPPPPNRPPVTTCSVDKSTITSGAGDVVIVRAQASDPDNDPLNYTWSATGGTVDGTGSEVRWNSTGLNAGNYTVKAHVDDGRGGSADCSADVTVAAPANRAPVMTCAVERSPIQPGERTRITATATDADNDALTYTWRTSAGKLTGTGATTEFDSTGLAAGSYTITGRVEDGRGGAADCSAAVEVQAPPAPPQASKTNECNYRASSSRADNVCKRVLDDVALRLKNEPKSSVLLIGYADPAEKRSAKLAQDRADMVKKYLTDKGVDASRVATRAAGGEKGAGKTNQRIDIVWVPEGATY